jgi:hypothetical protein
MNINRSILAALGFALALSPAFASAETVSDLQAQIQSLLSQLKGLQTQLHQAKSSSTATTTSHMGNAFGKRCIELSRDIRKGHRGDDVREIQKFLREHPESGFTGADTGFFGDMTEKALKRLMKVNGVVSTSTSTVPRDLFMRDCVQGMKNALNNANEVRGAVASVSGTTFTVTLIGTTTRTVVTQTNTEIKVFTSATSSGVTGTITDITVGKMVKVEGTPQTDGSLLAREIKVHPAGTMMKMEDGSMMKTIKKLFDTRGRRSGGDDN